MTRQFIRTRIRGISFRTGLSKRASVAGSSKHPVDMGLSTEELRLAKAVPLTAGDIHHLLGDLARKEIHSHVVECIDQITRWRQVSNQLDKQTTLRTSRDLRNGTLENADLTNSESQDDLSPDFANGLQAVEIRMVLHSWRHRLAILELISDAQYSIQDEIKLARLKKKSV